MQTIELTDIEKDFAQYVGYEVNLKDGGTGINLGLYFPDTWAADGIIKPNGVNVFFPEQNKIFVQNFNQVELIFPNGINRMNPSEALFGFAAFLTTRDQAITIGAAHSTPAVLELLNHFIKVNSLPRCRDGWEQFLVPVSEGGAAPLPTKEDDGILVTDGVFDSFDAWCQGKYEFVDGDWYCKEDNEGNQPISTKDLFSIFIKSIKG